MNHTEGAWPKEIDSTSAEQITVFRRKVERDAGFMTQLRAKSADVTQALSQNVTLDIYSKGFDEYKGDHASEVPRLQLVTSIWYALPHPAHTIIFLF